jgi:hypothetical protein
MPTPHEMQYQNQLHEVLQRIEAEKTGAGLVRPVRQANERVDQVNTPGTSVPIAAVVTVDLDRERQAMTRRTPATT